MSERLILAFQDTQKRLWENELLCQLTSQTVLCTQIFPEKYETTRVVGSFPTGISVTEETTLQAARRMSGKYTKTAVLNFANAVNPGGGVLYGARAQEEDLCRCSNLYSCLVKPELYDSFYNYNNAHSPYYSDRVIYSPNVTVFKTEGEVPEYTDNWFQVDILTCPAPNLNGITVADYQKLEKIYRDRIRNIMAVAEAHGVQALVLGAYGCGAFHNPPELMAKAFLHEITQGDYRNVFREIVFAIKADSPKGYNNLKVFQNILCPWQENPLYGKKVSILGDSISTYWGSSPEEYPVFYTAEQCIRTGLYSVEDTWWMKVLHKMGGNLLTNNSCADSCVAYNSTFSANNDDRLYRLYKDDQIPDVVLVTMGISDYEHGVSPEPKAGEIISWDTYFQNFKSSYQMMLWKIQQFCPAAEIYCATLSYGVLKGRTNSLFARGPHGIPLKEYNRVIRECADEYGCRVADIAREVKTYESIDGVHPTAAGMCQLADGWINAMNDQKNTFYFQEKESGKGRKWLKRALIGLVGILVVAEAVLIGMLLI
ncbi:MAG: TIGR02452 family protein [Ruminococcus sp.]|nr:TIGR02452 family protein [Ruminococcus sp.]